MPDTEGSLRAAPGVPPATTAGSSRTSAQAAGWECSTPGTFAGLVPENRRRMSWFNPTMLWECRNDVLARLVDPVPAERAQWVKGLSDEDLTVDLSDRLDRFSFLLMGDTGEGDHSQYALVPPLVAQAPTTEFLFICSDVLYPIGNVNDYNTKFYKPYSRFEAPIYAIPGNHDWYDDLFAFMYHLCGRTRDASAGPPASEDTTSTLRLRLAAAVRRTLWRKPDPPDEDELASMAKLRELPGQRQPVPQPGPYYVIDTAQMRFVCVDTGILGNLDGPQGEWLVRVSADPRPKMLLTGSPLLVDGHCEPCPIVDGPEGYATVLDVVHDPRFNYVASIGGNIHNYQRYPVERGGRTIQHVVSGGGGAFMHATHLIGRIDPDEVLGVTEDEFRCYPLRRDSLASYSRVLQRILQRVMRRAGVRLNVEMTPDEAARLLSQKLDVTPLSSRPLAAPGPGGQSVAGRTPLEQLLMRRMLAFGGKRFHKWFSPFYDWDSPPFFKSFLRITVNEGSATVTCLGVTGCADTEDEPTVEDRFELHW
jgi:hypothetical protein